MDAYDGEEIVISGIGGNFPECDTVDKFMDNLFKGVDMVTDDRPRWEPGALDVPMRVGKMKSLQKCDAQYFGLIGKQCHALDPITRKVLERTHEAIFDAGLNPADLAGTRTGVFFGTSIIETEITLMETKSSDAYNILGRNRSMNANRVSYVLDLKGPSLALDCTWSSGLQVLALAFQYMKSGLCDAALVSAGSSILYPEFSQHFLDMKILSPEGVTRAFDDEANGCTRSEAVVAIFLQKLKDAKRNYGIVVNAVGEAMNSVPGQIFIPKREDWLALLRKFYDECKVDPNEVAYLEADGLAHREADSAELNAVCEIFCREREASKPLLVGTVKSNLGHTLAAAGLCSLAKVLVASQMGIIPPNLHYSSPNKAVTGLLTGQMKVVTLPTALDGNLIAINDFGIGGTYGHCLIRRPRNAGANPRLQSHESKVPRLVLVSARNEESMEAVLDKIEEMPALSECIPLIDDIFSRNIPHHMNRGYTILPKKEMMTRSTTLFQGDKRPVWFIFSGMGSHWATMGKDLLRLPAFKESIDRCHEVLMKKGLDLHNILTNEDTSLLENILNSFVSISSVQVALVDILTRLGIRPDGIIGHSAGELGASYADGCLSLEETMLSSYFRGKVSNEGNVIKGMMAAIGKGWSEVEALLPEDVEVACHNSSTNCTISGPSESVISFAKKMKEEGTFVKVVNVSNIAFHSEYIKELGPKLKEELDKIILQPKRRSSRWISSSVPESRWHEPEWNYCSSNYHTNNLLSHVYFEEACEHIPKDAIVIEIAPHSLLLPILKKSLSKDCICIGLTHRNASDQLVHLLQMIGKLYTAGLQPRISSLYPPVKFPVPLGTPFLGSLATWDHSFSWSTKLGERKISNKCSKDLMIHLGESAIYRSLKIEDQHFLPCSVFLVSVLKIFSSAKKITTSDAAVTFQDIVFKNKIALSKTSLSLSITYFAGTGKFEVLTGNKIVVTGTVTELTKASSNQINRKYSDPATEEVVRMSGDEVYSELAHSGYQFEVPLRSIRTVRSDGNVWESRVLWTGDVAVLVESILQCHLLAFDRSRHFREISCIGEISLESKLLPRPGEELDLCLDARTGVLNGKGINVRGVTFKMTDREPLPLPRKSCPKADIFLESKAPMRISMVEFFAGNVRAGQIAYSGTLGSSTGVMGLGCSERTSATIEPDPILRWHVPSAWSLEEAAGVPLPYSLAYFMMKIMADVKPHDSVLVTNATTNIGLASAAVALEYTNGVFATVNEEEEKLSLVKCFPQMRDKVIVVESERDDQLVIDLMTKTKQKGTNFVVSTYNGRKIEKYLSCLSSFSHFFQVFLEDTEQDFHFSGTDRLVLHSSIYGITLGSVLASSESDKVRLRDLVARGIDSHVVIPLPVRRSSLPPSVIEKSELIRVENDLSSARFRCKSQNSYLIISGTLSEALLVAEWFIEKRAKNIIVLHSDNAVTGRTLTKINALKKSTSLSVVRIESFDDATLERSLRSFENVHAAVVLPLDGKLPGDDISHGVEYCEERNRGGRPTLALVWDTHTSGKTKRFTEALDQLLDCEGVIRIQETSNEDVHGSSDVDELLSSLPKNQKELAEYGETTYGDAKVTEIKTLSLPWKHAKETPPIFLVGDIGSRKLAEWFRRCLYPAFWVELPHLGNASIEEFASYAIPKITSVSRGPYIIVGEKWGGCVALELGRQLEHLGSRAHVFLLSGTPMEVVEPLRRVAAGGDSLEIALISRLLGITEERVSQELPSQTNWAGKVCYSSQFISEERQEEVRKGLNAIKSRIEAVANYSLKEAINGPVTVVTKRDIPSEHYGQLCRNRVAICEVSEGEDVLNDDIFRLIHDTAVHNALEV